MPTELEELKDSDVYVDDSIQETKVAVDKTGYPFDLTEEQIIRIIYFFGARKLSSRALKGGHAKTTDFTSMEKRALDHFFNWFGLVVNSESDMKKAYKVIVLKLKAILGFLKTRPAYITKDIHNALDIAGYKNITKNIIYVVNENKQIVPRLIANQDQKETIPLANMDKMQWEIQNMTLDKIFMVIQSITPKDLIKANLGSKSKAVRDLFAMYHMSKLNNKTPNLSLININVNNSDPKEKLSAFSNYIVTNRDNKN